MSIELITGMAETAHISANDYRAINRANYGSGRYILKDAEDMEVNIFPASGTVIVKTGSCMWSGMHIRCAETTTLKYNAPTVITSFFVYLHYKKDAETLYESVEFVISSEEINPTINDVQDSTMEAYTILFHFTHDPSDTSSTTANYHFKTIDTHEDFDLETLQKDIVFAKSAAIGESKAYTDGNFLTLQSQIEPVLKPPQALFSGSGGDLSNGLTFNVTDLEQYKYIGFHFRDTTRVDLDSTRATVMLPVRQIQGGSGFRNTMVISVYGNIRTVQFYYSRSEFYFDAVANTQLLSVYGYY